MPTIARRNNVRFSIRGLMATVAVLAAILGAYEPLGLLGVFPILLAVGVLLINRGRHHKRPVVAGVGWAASILSFLALSLIGFSWFITGRGPIYTPSAFPDQLRRMVEVAGADASSAKVFRINDHWDAEYVWRLPLTARQFERVVARYKLVHLPDDDVPTFFRRSFPYWWRPTHNRNCRYVVTPNRGDATHSYIAMFDARTQLFYVRYFFHF